MENFRKDLPLEVKRRRNAKEDMARLINLQHELLIEIKRQNQMLMDLLGVPALPKKSPVKKEPKNILPQRPKFLST